MIVHIFGPCNCGKTMLRNRLKELHPGYDSWCIDDFRRKLGDGTLEKELEAQDAYVEAVENVENGFFECSGTGRCATLSLMNRKEDVCIVIFDTPAEMCKERIMEGKYDGIPFPFENSDEDIIDAIRRDLDSGYFDLFHRDIPILRLNGNLPLDE